MSVSLNITKITVPENYKKLDEITVTCNLQDLSSSDIIFIGTKTIPLTALGEHLKTNGLRAGNFHMKDGAPIMSDPLFKLNTNYADEPLTETNNKARGFSVVGILSHLAKTKTRLKFDESYYTTKTSGVNYDTFIPDFESATMNASNLIVSAKKFNIVLTASIRGDVLIENGYTEVFRFHPFKLVKFGQLQHNKIYAYVNQDNYELLEDIGEGPAKDGIIEIDLSKFTIFETYNINSSVNNLLLLIRQMLVHKLRIRGNKYHLTALRVSMANKSYPNEKRDWFSGEEVDEDYLSDEGTEYIHVWEKGKQQSNSVDKVFTELNTFGEGTAQLIKQITNLEEVELTLIKDSINTTNRMLVQLMKQNLMTKDEAIMIGTLMQSMEIEGDYQQRNVELIKRIKTESLDLNILEMKLLTLRWNIHNKKLDSARLGGVTKKTKDRYELQTQQGSIIIKHGIVEKAYDYQNKGGSHGKQEITNDIYN